MSRTLMEKNKEQHLVGALLQIPLFQRLHGRFLQIWLKGARSRPLKMGDPLCGPGDLDPSLYILLKGQLERDKKAGGVRLWKAITTVGEIEAMTGQLHTGTIFAAQDALVLEIPRRYFLLVLSQDASVCHRVCRNLIDRLAAELVEANTRTEALERRRTELAQAIQEAEMELNDLRMLRSFRA